MKYLFDYRVWLLSIFIISFIGAVIFASPFWCFVLIAECYIMAFWGYAHREDIKK